jgi:hypothetical protein
MRSHRKIGQCISVILCRLAKIVCVGALAVCLSGCACKAVSNHQWAGHKPPKISRPEDIAANLLESINGPVSGFSRKASFFFTPFKRIGVMGWSDLGYDGEITAVVRQTAKSADRFYTVDMLLESLRIDGRTIPLPGKRYLRAEVCLCDVKFAEGDWPVVGDHVWMRGRIVWDGDGFVEIHPRNATEIRRGDGLMHQ